MPSLAAAAVTFALLCSAGSAHAQRPLPDPLDTPGAVNLAVNQGNIGTTICAPGWTDTVRPPSRFTSALKLRQLSTWIAYAGGPPEAYEEDNLIPLELGGSPTDQRNLWPEPRQPPSGWGSDRKEGLERVLHRLVCDGRLPLAFAQRTIARDWIGAYRQFVLSSQRMR